METIMAIRSGYNDNKTNEINFPEGGELKLSSRSVACIGVWTYNWTWDRANDSTWQLEWICQ